MRVPRCPRHSTGLWTAGSLAENDSGYSLPRAAEEPQSASRCTNTSVDKHRNMWTHAYTGKKTSLSKLVNASEWVVFE